MVYQLLIATAGLALLLAGWVAIERLAAAARNRARTETHTAAHTADYTAARTESCTEAPRAPACAACAASCQPGAEPPEALEGQREAARPSTRFARGLRPV